MKTHICLLVIASLFLFECNGVTVKYPSSDPCIMVKMDANISLTQTGGLTPLKAAGTLAGAVLANGDCKTTPTISLTLDFGVVKNGPLMTLTFNKGTDSKVNMDVKATFLPDAIFKNGDTQPKTMTEDGSLTLSTDTASYTCSGDQEIKFKPLTVGNFTYQFKMIISDVQIQAFNVQNGTFSTAEDCSAVADVSSEAPTSQPPTQPPTQPAQTTQPPNTTDAGNQTTQPPAAPTTQPPSNVTTPAGTTMPPKNESTSEVPTTKAGTTMAPTTTEPPTPKPGSPDTETYKATGPNGTCVLIKAGIEFKIPYMSTSKQNKTAIIGIPSGNDTTAQGNCNGPNNTQSVTVNFYNNDWTLELKFAEASDSEFYLSDANLAAKLTSDVISDIAAPVTINVNQAFGKDQFKAAKDGSYKCNDETTVKVGGQIEMNTYNLQYAAFQKNITAFTDNGVSECSSDTSTNSVVPIAVGAALAGLVVIVLIAYLIGRKRSRQSGYEQV